MAINNLKKPRESDIEAYLREKVRAVLHGKAYKWVSPGNNGVPDRMVCLPGGRVVFAELKAPGKQPRPEQAAKHRELRALGFHVEVLDSKAAVEAFIEELRGAQP